ncbi:MAG TPA: AsmA-like C-terminal region-containing protein, partial [Candidatus Krumholzibacteriaceae bacterium]
AAAPPVHISSLKARAEISGPDVKKLSGGFNIGASPYTFNGSMINIMPAAAELALVAQGFQAAGQKAIPDLGTLLDRMANVPVVTFDIAGRSFDARAYEQPLAGAAPEGAKATGASAPVPTPPAATGPGAILFLKNTTFTAKLDSIITREAVITGLDAKGTIRDGRVKVDPVAFAYAGGRGASTVNADLRKSERVETKVDLSMDGIEAAQALSRFGAAAGLIQGKFSFKSNASLATGPGVAPLAALSATGSALSNKGIVSFESFIAPLSNIKGFDVTPFKSFDYSEWRGSFVVKNGRFICDDWKFNSSRGAWSIKGSFGFDGTLDYAVHVVIPPAVQSMMQGLDQYKGALDLMRDKSGNLVLDVKIGGTTKHPTASLDLTQAQNKMQDKLIEGLKKKFLK